MNQYKNLKFLKCVLVLLSLILPVFTMAQNIDSLRHMHVQDGGRVKPYDSFAREALKLIYGSEKYNGKDAASIVFIWMVAPKLWNEIPVIQVRHKGLREALKLVEDPDRVYYSPKELFMNDRVGLLVQDLKTKIESQEKLNPYFQAIQNLENQLSLFHAIKMGQAFKVAPPVTGNNWQTVSELDGDLKNLFADLSRAFIKLVTMQSSSDSEEAKQAQILFDESVKKYVDIASKIQPEVYGDNFKVKTEVHLNVFHPFRWAWVFYLLGGFLLFCGWVSNKNIYHIPGWVFTIFGLVLHTYGMVIRSYILGRPPVSNMYETVVWVPWGGLIFAMIFEKWTKNRSILMVASLVSVLCLILTDMAPSVLDKSLQPLEPVLRDNFWLTTHVLIITLSYALFFLAFALGDLQLFYFLKDEEKYKQKIQAGTIAIYRAIQVGIILLGAGIILGGIWADYSWGRFWGWDPKETWALIAWFGYLAILHGRLVGWVKNFGMAVSSVIAFSLVIMAWYGVNFVLGAGLHSYGFGAGGVEYVAVFVAVHILFVIYVATVRYSKLKSKQS